MHVLERLENIVGKGENAGKQISYWEIVRQRTKFWKK